MFVITFTWDDRKAAANFVKHGVSFALAQEVWSDPLYVVIPDRFVDGEQRWHAVGTVGHVVVLVVVHSHPLADDDATIRIISARRATRQERRRYEEST
ncbi:MAG TPA: BrnT family toxin [Sphingomonas sp.]|jgi:hypothetical protein